MVERSSIDEDKAGVKDSFASYVILQKSRTEQNR